MKLRQGPFLLFVGLFAAGCSQTHPIDVDLSAEPPRFLLNGRTWGWPFRWPQLNSLAIGSGDESLWEIEALDEQGVPARDFAIVYGEVPAGFRQNMPVNNARPRRLVQGRSYFVGATGPNGEIFRTIFALPVDPLGVPSHPESTPDRQRMDPRPAWRPTTKPAD